MISKIYEYKGKQELYVANFSDVLEKMVEVAKIQSTKSSNAIEGISTNDSRLEELMKKKSEPRNRNEEEIYGYREVLDIIHENYSNIDFTKNNILTLHSRLYYYSSESHKGKFKRGIEVGNIFQLGQKYSKSMNATFLDENGKEQFFWMGSYGIGVTRSVSAIVEQNHDDKGMIWPLVVAPYHVIITVVNTKNEEQNTLAEKLYEKLLLQGVEVLLDDRKERVGVKFNDRDLIGIPLRITVGKKADEDIVEFSERKTLENVEMSSTEAYEKVMEIINANLKSVGGLYR